MKNNALKLISLAVLAPMMTACPKPQKETKNWNQDVQDAMVLYAGEVLPFAELDEGTLEFGYDADYLIFYLYDDNEVNVLENYSEALVAAGFEEVSNEVSGETYITYDKLNEVGAISVSFGFDEGDEDVAPGNYINVQVPEYLDEDLLDEYGYDKQTGWPEALVGETLGDSGITMAPVNATGEWWVADDLYVDEEDGSSYMCAYLITKGDYFDAIYDDLTGKGLDYYEPQGCFYDPTYGTDAEIYVSIVRDFTIINIYGPTLTPEITNETVNEDGSIDVSFTFSGNFTNGQSFESYTFESTSANLTVAKAGASNNPAYYDNGATLRFYAGSTLTIAAAEGLKINSVELTIGPSNSKAWTNAANLYSATSGTISATTDNTSIASVNANSLTITLGVGKTSGNIAFSQIVVNVVAAE